MRTQVPAPDLIPISVFQILLQRGSFILRRRIVLHSLPTYKIILLSVFHHNNNHPACEKSDSSFESGKDSWSLVGAITECETISIKSQLTI